MRGSVSVGSYRRNICLPKTSAVHRQDESREKWKNDCNLRSGFPGTHTRFTSHVGGRECRRGAGFFIFWGWRLNTLEKENRSQVNHPSSHRVAEAEKLSTIDHQCFLIFIDHRMSWSRRIIMLWLYRWQSAGDTSMVVQIFALRSTLVMLILPLSSSVRRKIFKWSKPSNNLDWFMSRTYREKSPKWK